LIHKLSWYPDVLVPIKAIIIKSRFIGNVGINQ
jgi:hypothetical protein